MFRLCVLSLLLVAAAAHQVFPRLPNQPQVFQILHTTDIHGWLNAHPHTPALDADIGDFISLVEHMKNNAAVAGEELLVFDSGDLIEGTGLSDATDVHGEYIYPVMQSVPYDGLTIGNHDIEPPQSVDFMRKQFIPAFGAKYITSNSFYKSDSGNTRLGSYYNVIDTAQGNRILTLGFIFNFEQNANNTVVENVDAAVADPLFDEAMNQQGIDLIVIACHIDPTTGVEFDQIYNAVRAKTSRPLVLLTGHRHIEYYKVLDSSNTALTIESGKYFEVIGRLRFTLTPSGFDQLEHTFVKTSLTNFYQLANRTSSNFITPAGTAAKKQIQKYVQDLDLNHVYGCVNLTYSPYDSLDEPTSLFGLFLNVMIPYSVLSHVTTNNTVVMGVNSFSLRDSLYSGKVNKNDVYAVMPFNDTFAYYPNVPGDKLKQLLGATGPHSAVLRGSCKAHLAGATLPPFVVANVTIDSDKTYDFATQEYDTFHIDQKMVSLWGQALPKQPLPTDQSTTTAIVNWLLSQSC